MRSEVREYRSAGAGIEERHDVAGTDDRIERFLDTQSGEVEFGEVGDEPCRAGVFLLSSVDEDWVDVDTDDVVADTSKEAADTSRPASGVEHSGSAGDHCVDEACLAVEVVSVGGHGAEPFDVPGGMARVRLGQLEPSVARHRVNASHGGIVTGRRRRPGRESCPSTLVVEGRIHESVTVRLEITRRAELATRALALLGESPERVKASVLADRLGTTLKFVPQVLGPLVRAGWVQSDPGPTGGYRSRPDVGDVSVLQVIEAVDGATDVGRCVVADRPCQSANPCVLHAAWTQARTELIRVLESTPISAATGVVV